jgi:hypothetical protein
MLDYIALYSQIIQKMTLITPDMTPEDIHRHAREMRKNLKYDFKKLCGTLTLTQDPVAIQKQMRDEWK